jgi:hypothetical protein
MEVAITAALAVGEGGSETNARHGKCGLMEILHHFHPLLEVEVLRLTDMYRPGIEPEPLWWEVSTLAKRY